MAWRLGKAKELTAGGEALFEKDLITDEAYAINKHGQLDERGFDCRIDQSMQVETPQPIKTTPVTVIPFIVNLPDNRRITSITFQANIATTDAVLNIRRAGESFWQKDIGVLAAGIETTIDLTGPDFVPIDLIDATAYVITVLEKDGSTVTLDGDGPNQPFYKWEYYTFTVEDIGYLSDIFPIVQTSVEGVDFGEAMSIQAGGDCLFQTNYVNDEIAAIVTHPYNEERAVDRFIEVNEIITNFPVWTINTDTLTNPTATFTALGDIRLTNIQLQSAGAQTNVKFVISDNATGKVIWQSMISSIPASGTFSIDFSDTTERNVPCDIFDTLDYDLAFSSEDGDVLLLGETATDQPWLTVSAYPFSNRALAYTSDLAGTDGTYFIDGNTTVSGADRDGSIFRPYKTIQEGLTDVGAATINDQHTFQIASGTYSEVISLPIYTHFISLSQDAENVRITTINVTDVGGYSSIRNIRADNISYDTSADVTSTARTLYLQNFNCTSGLSAIGRGAGSDTVIVDGFCILDDFNPITNIYMRHMNSYPVQFAGTLNVRSEAGALNNRDGYECYVELVNVDYSQTTTSGLAASGTTDCYLELNDIKGPSTWLVNIMSWLLR